MIDEEKKVGKEIEQAEKVLQQANGRENLLEPRERNRKFNVK